VKIFHECVVAYFVFLRASPRYIHTHTFINQSCPCKDAASTQRKCEMLLRVQFPSVPRLQEYVAEFRKIENEIFDMNYADRGPGFPMHCGQWLRQRRHQCRVGSRLWFQPTAVLVEYESMQIKIRSCLREHKMRKQGAGDTVELKRSLVDLK